MVAIIPSRIILERQTQKQNFREIALHWLRSAVEPPISPSSSAQQVTPVHLLCQFFFASFLPIAPFPLLLSVPPLCTSKLYFFFGFTYFQLGFGGQKPSPRESDCTTDVGARC